MRCRPIVSGPVWISTITRSSQQADLPVILCGSDASYLDEVIVDDAGRADVCLFRPVIARGGRNAGLWDGLPPLDRRMRPGPLFASQGPDPSAYGARMGAWMSALIFHPGEVMGIVGRKAVAGKLHIVELSGGPLEADTRAGSCLTRRTDGPRDLRDMSS